MKNSVMKNSILVVFFLLVSFVIILLTNYRTNVYEVNKEFFHKIIYEEAKNHFENLKVFRAWNSKYGGVYVKSNGNLKPNEYLENNHIFSDKGELLVKINPAWMTKQVSELMNNSDGRYKYKITSLNPLNPENKPNDFEKEALNFFDKNLNENYYYKVDDNEEIFNFMGKLLVDKSCLQCHAVQGYKEGEVRGGISISIPLEYYKFNEKELDYYYKIQIFLIVLIGIFIYCFLYYIVNKFYKKQEELTALKEKYKIMYERYDQAINSAELGLWDWNLITNEIYFSKVWKNMLGYRDDEVENNLDFWDKNVHPDDKEKAYEDILNNQNKKTKHYENIHRIKHKNGSWIWILDRGKTIFDENEKAIRMIGFHTDITSMQNLKEEIKNKEEIMIAQSRHAAMGEMISMIAHQWRQPISVIGMACNNILIDIELEMLDTEQLKDNTESMLEQTKYLSQTIDDFRNFFKPNKEKEIINPKLIIDETLSIMGKSLENNDISIVFDKKDDCEVQIYSRELLQVFLNIIKNAKESFEGKNIDNKFIEISIKKINQKVRIEIYDNAGKIDEKIIDKIFEPYFSTKDEKSGTGLGLYMSKTIVEKHLNGEFGCFNTKEGVSFYVDLVVEK